MAETLGNVGRFILPIAALLAPTVAGVFFDAPIASAATCLAHRCMDLTPASASNPVLGSHTVHYRLTTANGLVTTDHITIRIVSGPDAGLSFGPTLDQEGDFTFTNNGVSGTDVIQACDVEPFASGLCDTATKTWVAPTPPATPPQFGGIALAIGGQAGYTEPCDADSCPTGVAAAGDDATPRVASSAEREADDDAS